MKRTEISVRILDLIIVIIISPFAIVLTLILCLLVFLGDFRNPIFVQKRLGLNKNEFYLLKIRTMKFDAEKQTGAVWASPDDSRITSLGHFLRNFRLDELPQVINILFGDLSFVGPRPIREIMADKILENDPLYEERFLVKPGLTGLAQIFAPYGSNMAEQVEKGYWDRYWLEHVSIKLYFLSLFWTVFKVLNRNEKLDQIKNESFSVQDENIAT